LPAAVPVITYSMKPIYCAAIGSLNPSDIPMTAKKVPTGLSDILSTITRRPEIAHALIKPAREQYSIKCLRGFAVVVFATFYISSLKK
jgi:hypothetical protein